MRNCLLSLIAITGMMLLAIPSDAREPGWTGPILASGDQRAQIESTPIPHRSYRPLHFYGNTVRRMYYRGTPLPSTRDVVEGGRLLLRPPQAIVSQ